MVKLLSFLLSLVMSLSTRIRVGFSLLVNVCLEISADSNTVREKRQCIMFQRLIRRCLPFRKLICRFKMSHCALSQRLSPPVSTIPQKLMLRSIDMCNQSLKLRGYWCSLFSTFGLECCCCILRGWPLGFFMIKDHEIVFLNSSVSSVLTGWDAA